MCTPTLLYPPGLLKQKKGIKQAYSPDTAMTTVGRLDGEPLGRVWSK